MTRAWICGSGVGVVPVWGIVGEGLSLNLPVEWPRTENAALIWPEE